MPNVALHKPVEGAHNTRAASEELPSATDGNVTNYGGHEGWSYFMWPGHLTVDLESIHAITCIRFLLYDSDRNRLYKYRLLASEDGKNWKVLFDTEERGHLGWQVFFMGPERLRAQYVRIHGLWNSSNDSFHVVQVEVYDDDPPVLDGKVNLQLGVILKNIETETDQTDIERAYERVSSIIEREAPDLIPRIFFQVLEQLRPHVRDIADVQRSVIGIRRQILKPIEDSMQESELSLQEANEELRRSTELSIQSLKYSKWAPASFWLAVVALVVSILSGILTILAMW